MRANVVDEPVLVSAHPEKIVGFLDGGGLNLVVGALTIHQLPLRVKSFTAETIEAFIFAEINIPVFLYLLAPPAGGQGPLS